MKKHSSENKKKEKAKAKSMNITLQFLEDSLTTSVNQLLRNKKIRTIGKVNKDKALHKIKSKIRLLLSWRAAKNSVEGVAIKRQKGKEDRSKEGAPPRLFDPSDLWNSGKRLRG